MSQGAGKTCEMCGGPGEHEVACASGKWGFSTRYSVENPVPYTTALVSTTTHRYTNIERHRYTICSTCARTLVGSMARKKSSFWLDLMIIWILGGIATGVAFAVARPITGIVGLVFLIAGPVAAWKRNVEARVLAGWSRRDPIASMGTADDEVPWTIATWIWESKNPLADRDERGAIAWGPWQQLQAPRPR